MHRNHFNLCCVIYVLTLKFEKYICYKLFHTSTQILEQRQQLAGAPSTERLNIINCIDCNVKREKHTFKCIAITRARQSAIDFVRGISISVSESEHRRDSTRPELVANRINDKDFCRKQRE